MNDFNALVVGGIPLLIVIFGLVEFCKTIGLTGRWLTVASLLLGLAFGIAFKISQGGMPIGFAGWFLVVVFGLALGLVTSGLYDFANARWPKV